MAPSRHPRRCIRAFLPCLLLTLAAILVGCARSATLSVTGPVEYSLLPVDASKVVTCDKRRVALTFLDDIDASRVGEQTITVQVGKGPLSKKEEVAIEVVDTEAPTIKLRHADSKLVIDMGDDFDPHDEIEEVADPVDGALEEIAQAADKPEAQGVEVGYERFYSQGFYLVEGDFDPKTAGTYELVVHAFDQHGNEAQESLLVEVADPLDGVKLRKTTKVLEYAQQDIDPVELVECTIEDAKVKADPLSLRKTGKAKVKFTVSKDKSRRNFTRTFRIRDTQSPVIKLADSEVEVEYGTSFDPLDNVVSVSDPVDGELAYLDSEPADNGNGWYTVVGSVDTDNAGRYHLTVVACDRNGNRVEHEFNVLVDESAEEDGEEIVIDDASIG